MPPVQRVPQIEPVGDHRDPRQDRGGNADQVRIEILRMENLYLLPADEKGEAGDLLQRVRIKEFSLHRKGLDLNLAPLQDREKRPLLFQAADDRPEPAPIAPRYQIDHLHLPSPENEAV